MDLTSIEFLRHNDWKVPDELPNMSFSKMLLMHCELLALTNEHIDVIDRSQIAEYIINPDSFYLSCQKLLNLIAQSGYIEKRVEAELDVENVLYNEKQIDHLTSKLCEVRKENEKDIKEIQEKALTHIFETYALMQNSLKGYIDEYEQTSGDHMYRPDEEERFQKDISRIQAEFLSALEWGDKMFASLSKATKEIHDGTELFFKNLIEYHQNSLPKEYKNFEI